MAALSPYFARYAVDRIAGNARKPVQDALNKICDLCGDDGRVDVATVLEALFPLQTRASANASLSRLVNEFNRIAEGASSPVRLEIAGAKKGGASQRHVWFDGPLDAPPSRQAELNAIPAEGLVEDQRGTLLDAPPVVVLLTVNENETTAVLRAFCPKRIPALETREGVTYHDLGVLGGLRLVHVVCSQGTHAALLRTLDAGHAWRPRAVVAVGVAFGMDDTRQRIGDVLVSTHVRAYELARVNADASVTLRGSKPDASDGLVNRIVTLDRTRRHANDTAWPRIAFGTLLSGDKLVDDLDYRNHLRDLAKEAIGGEMEGLGVYLAASRVKADWIVVKAICDWGDGAKSKDKQKRQELAAANAALVVREALAEPGLYAPDGGGDGGELFRRERADRLARPKPLTALEYQRLDDLRTLPALVPDAEGTTTTLDKDSVEHLRSTVQGVPALRHIIEWATDRNATPLFALLGEYGMGKTVTCQRLTADLGSLRAEDPSVPPCLYFDLRHVSVTAGVPSAQSTIECCIERGWSEQADGRRATYADVLHLMDQGAVVVIDGLDEVLVKLDAADGQLFTAGLLKLLTDANGRRLRDARTPQARMLVSCRTQFFRTLRDQKNHFTGQERGDVGHASYRALILLPFSLKQIRHYLRGALPEADHDRMLDMIGSIHNLTELSQRPYTLKLVAEFIPEIERERAGGRVVRGVTLYRKAVLRWLDRDAGKHHLLPDHKLRLAAHLAAELWRSRRAAMPVADLEAWFHRWLQTNPDLERRYRTLHPECLEEDLRTATFLVREDQDGVGGGFRFAHTSLQEYFLAEYLFEAMRHNRPDDWAMPVPSAETLEFLGQIADEASTGEHAVDAIYVMQQWKHAYRPQTSELVLAYAMAARRGGRPAPVLARMDLTGAKLREWTLALPGHDSAAGRLDLSGARLTNADLRDARLQRVRLDGANLTGARCERAEFELSSLAGTDFTGAGLAGTLFRKSALHGAVWTGADTYRTRFVACDESPSAASRSLVAPLSDLDSTSPRRVAALAGHTSWVYSCAFAPDGARLASAGRDGIVRVWDARSGDLLLHFAGGSGPVLSCAFASDGARLVSAGDDGSVRVWDAHSGEALLHLFGHTGWVRSCAFAPDGTRVVSAGADGTVRVWDARSGEALLRLTGHNDPVHSCAFAPDGARLVSAGYDGSVRVWNAHSGEPLLRLTGHKGWVLSCAFAPDGARLVSTGHDGTVRVWDAHSGEALLELTGHAGHVFSCGFAPDGARLVSAGGDGTVRVWDAHSGEALLQLTGHTGIVWSCAFAPDGARLVSAGDHSTVQVWDAGSGEALMQLTGLADWVRSCAFAPDGARMVSAGDDGAVRVWDVNSGEALLRLTEHTGPVLSCAFAPDGARVVSTGEDGTARVWDAHSGEALLRLTGHSGWVYCCAFAPDGARLASAGADGTVRVWDAGSGAPLLQLTGHSNPVSFCAFASDGARLASADRNGTMRLWDARSGEALLQLTGHWGWVFCCAFAPDGARLVSAGAEGTVRVWDSQTGEVLLQLTGHTGPVRSCAFAPDGARMVSAGDDGTVRVWDSHSGESLLQLTGHTGPVFSCAFAPDGARLVSAGLDGTLRVWNAYSGEPLLLCLGTQTGTATLDLKANQVVELGGDAWRRVVWQVRDEALGWMPVPIETFGMLPEPKRLVYRSALGPKRS